MDMFFTQRKLEGRIRELGEYRYRDVRNFESFLAKEDKSGLVNPDCRQILPAGTGSLPALTGRAGIYISGCMGR